MARTDRGLGRRTVLRATATAGLAVAGLSATASAETATAADCRVCWVDVKPDSCPNSLNPDNGGVVSVAAGWPNFDPDAVELLPISGDSAEDVGFEPAFDRCQDYRDQQYAEDCSTLEELAARSDGRAATPVRATTVDIDDDGDPDSVFKFETADLELQADDAYLLLTGESTDGGSRVYGIDSVRVLDRGQGNGSQRGGDANGAGR